ncbi:hypothetical protein ACWC5C_21080 [Streptomyces sp. NPDC001700]
MRFPDLRELGPLSVLEWETLRSLNRACVDLRQEWKSACTQIGRAATRMELTEDYAQHSGFFHHLEAVNAAYEAASDYEWRVSRITWRYASASALLGIRVLDRLVSGQPPLAPSLVKQLASTEPTLGQLSEAFSLVPSRLRAAQDAGDQQRDTVEYELLTAAMRRVYYDVTHQSAADRGRTAKEADECRLTLVSEPDVDPLWEYLLEPVLQLAERLPYDISWWLSHAGVRSGV